MGLTRASSGLLLRDDFGSDTESAYTLAGADKWAVSNGTFTYAGNTWEHSSQRRADISTAKCATARIKQAEGNLIYAVSLGVGVGGSGCDDTGEYFPNGYCFCGRQLYGISSGTDTALAAFTNLADYDYYDFRLYIASGTVVAKRGKGSLADIASVSNSTFAQGHVFVRSSYIGNFDYLDARTAHTITCSGMTEGHYLRVSDGTTAAEAQESGGTATVDAGGVLFPLASVQIRTAAAGGGDLIAELDTGDYADMGGGDAFTYSASGLWLPQLIKPQYFPQFGGLTYG